MWTRHVDAKRQLEGHSEYRLPQAQVSPSMHSRTDVDWPAEKIREVGQQAGSAMSEISESALDALMIGLQTLKVKLAETREQRELGRDADKLYLEHRLPTDESSNGPPSFGRGPRLV